MDFSWSLVQPYPSLYNVLASVLQLNIRIIISLHSPTRLLLSFALSVALFFFKFYFLPLEGILVELICFSANNLVKARKRLLIMLFHKHKEREL